MMRQQDYNNIRQARNNVIWSVMFLAFAAACFGGTAIIRHEQFVSRPILFALYIASFVMLIAAPGWIMATLDHYRFIKSQYDDTDNDDNFHAASMLELSAEHQPQSISIEYPEDAQIRVAKLRLTRRQWRTLATRLSENNWRWVRRHLQGIVKSYSAEGVYPGITRDMERAGVVDKGKVTVKGREAICEAAGLEVVI
jgi:hypothetical protein